MLSRDELKRRYERYLDRVELDDSEEEEIMSFEEFEDGYITYLESLQY